MAEADLLIEDDKGLLTVTLNRPDALNALTVGMGRLLKEALANAARDPRIRAVLLTGTGRAFCAGGDVKKRGKPDPTDSLAAELGDDPAWNGVELRTARMVEGARTFLQLHTMSKPTIAMINGLAIGAGLAAALACDIRFIAEDAWLNTSYAGQGLSGTSGLNWLLTESVGVSKARELMFFPRKIEAAEALALGLVHRVIPHDKLRKETLAAARQLASGPTLALGHIKENVRAAYALDLETAIDTEARNYVSCTQTEDYAEAMAAIRDKLIPKFRGR